MNLTPTTVRADLKCGKGAIRQGQKCTKGPTSSVQRQRPPKQATFAEKGLVALGTAATIGGLIYARRHRVGPSLQRERAANAVAIAGGGLGLVGAGLGLYGKRTNNEGAKQLGAGIALTGGLFAQAGGNSAAEERAHRQRMRSYENMNFDPPKWNNKNWGDWSTNSREYYGYRRQNTSGGNDRRNTYGSGRTRGANEAVPNPYSDLGVNENSSDLEIKNAWKNLMRQHHPDLGGDPQKAKKVNAAYQEILRRRGRRDSVWAEGFTIDWEALDL